MGENMSDDDRSRLSIAELQSLKPYGDSDVPAMLVARARLVNATPVLLEAVAAAYQKAKKIAARTRARLAQMNFPDDLSRECEVLDNEELRCRGAFVAALAMVRE